MTDEELKQRIDRCGEHILNSLPESETSGKVVIPSLFWAMMSIIRVHGRRENPDNACDIIRDLIAKLYEQLAIVASFKEEDTKHD